MDNDFRQRKVRVAFQPLSYTNKHLAEPNELIIDYKNGNGYVKDSEGISEIQINGGDIVQLTIQDKIDELLDGVGNDGDSLAKLRDLLAPLEDWKISLTASDYDNIVNTLTEIIDKFRGMSETEQTLLLQINKKIDKVYGKGLTTNDFTNDLLDKLINIEDGANNYSHPDNKICDYEAPIKTVNNKTGAIVLSKSDIKGLENVDPNANNYSHPNTKQCSYNFLVSTVNGMDGDVTLTKTDIGLDKVENYPVATKIQAEEGTSDKLYMTPLRSYEQIVKFITEYINS